LYLHYPTAQTSVSSLIFGIDSLNHGCVYIYIYCGWTEAWTRKWGLYLMRQWPKAKVYESWSVLIFSSYCHLHPSHYLLCTCLCFSLHSFLFLTTDTQLPLNFFNFCFKSEYYLIFILKFCIYLCLFFVSNLNLWSWNASSYW